MKADHFAGEFDGAVWRAAFRCWLSSLIRMMKHVSRGWCDASFVSLTFGRRRGDKTSSACLQMLPPHLDWPTTRQIWPREVPTNERSKPKRGVAILDQSGALQAERGDLGITSCGLAAPVTARPDGEISDKRFHRALLTLKLGLERVLIEQWHEASYKYTVQPVPIPTRLFSGLA